MTHKEPLTLAIESAIRGGSISLIEDGREKANWIGSTDVSKAEELLANIDAMLKANGLTVRDVGHVAVSAGPGSFTGIRIGLATALGLSRGLAIPLSSVSALSAMAETCEFHGDAIVAIPVGRSGICKQMFTREGQLTTAATAPEAITMEQLLADIQNTNDMNFNLHRSLYEHADKNGSTMDFGENIAFAIGLACAADPGSTVEPLFISKNY